MTFDQDVIVIYMLDANINMKQAVYCVVKTIISIAFFGILKYNFQPTSVFKFEISQKNLHAINLLN